jgi:hypothetical protein
MASPWTRVEHFEKQHGDHNELLARLTGDPSRDREVSRLLRAHSRLVAEAVAYQLGYNDGFAKGKEAACRSEP